jgi:archaellum component FlaC
LKRAEQERDTAIEQQQEGWRESRLMSQKIDSLMQLLVAKENDELRELRRTKDRSKGLEAELAAAKMRVTELETRVEGLVRSEAKAAQSVDDSKRQMQDYEAKLQKLEREIEPLRRLDDAQKTRDREFEQIRSQLQLQERQEVRLR